MGGMEPRTETRLGRASRLDSARERFQVRPGSLLLALVALVVPEGDAIAQRSISNPDVEKDWRLETKTPVPQSYFDDIRSGTWNTNGLGHHKSQSIDCNDARQFVENFIQEDSIFLADPYPGSSAWGEHFQNGGGPGTLTFKSINPHPTIPGVFVVIYIKKVGVATVGEITKICDNDPTTSWKPCPAELTTEAEN